MDDFLVQEHEEAQELAAQPFGATLLHHVVVLKPTDAGVSGITIHVHGNWRRGGQP